MSVFAYNCTDKRERALNVHTGHFINILVVSIIYTLNHLPGVLSTSSAICVNPSCSFPAQCCPYHHASRLYITGSPFSLLLISGSAIYYQKSDNKVSHDGCCSLSFTKACTRHIDVALVTPIDMYILPRNPCKIWVHRMSKEQKHTLE